MSRLGTGEGEGMDPGRARRAGGGAASVTLREQSQRGDNVAGLMDPAAKSLADALRITYRLLQVGMAAIFAVFLFSGFHSVKESERGMRLVFGKVESSDLPPGFQFSLPEPIGELIRLPTGEQTIVMNKEFFPSLTDQEEERLRSKGYSSLTGPGSNSLDPDADGALLTGDGNIVHARFSVTYRRARPWMTAFNVAEDAGDTPGETVEKRIVGAAVKRGMVRAAAGVSIDEFLKNQADPGHADFRPVEVVAKSIAQQTLDSIDSGIEIQGISLTERNPPRQALDAFNRVQSSQSSANAFLQKAESERLARLNRVAGEGAELLLSQIDEYEHELETGKTDEAARTIDRIRDVMLRRPVMIGGHEIVAGIFGQVSSTIADAERYRTTVVQEAQSTATVFAAKREGFRANPAVFIAAEWSDALRTALKREQVQVMQLPQNLERLVLQINRDPSITRDLETARLEKEAKARQDERIRNRSRENLEQPFDGSGG